MSVAIRSALSGITADSRIVVATSPKIMVTDEILFHVTGNVLLHYVVARCEEACSDAGPITMRWRVDNLTTGSSRNISGESPDISSVVPGQVLYMDALTGLSLTPELSGADGACAFVRGEWGISGVSDILSRMSGTPATGKWVHAVEYEPVSAGAMVIPGF